MSIDVANLSGQMIAAARGVVGGQWPATQKYFESEVRIFAERFATIEGVSRNLNYDQAVREAVRRNAGRLRGPGARESGNACAVTSGSLWWV